MHTYINIIYIYIHTTYIQINIYISYINIIQIHTTTIKNG